MLRAEAVSGDAGLVSRLHAGGFRARVHSVFQRVVNLECATTGRLYTLACAGVDNAPSTLVLDARTFGNSGVRPGARVECDGRTLVSESALAVSLARAKPWVATLPEWPSGDMPVLWLRELIDRCGTRGGIKRGPAPEPPYEAHLTRRIGDATSSLKAALQAGELSAAYEHGTRLIGLGRGLTPAGDDYLVGLSTICSVPGSPVGRLRPVMARLVRDSADRTNDISHAAMAHAIEGRVRESIAELVDAMARDDDAGMQRWGEQVIGIGATSGTDILAGMLAGLELSEAERN